MGENQNTASFLIAGGIYGGTIKLLTDRHVIPATLITFDSTPNRGMFITTECHEKILDINAIYITYTSDTGNSVHHIIEPVVNIKKENQNSYSFNGKLTM